MNPVRRGPDLADGTRTRKGEHDKPIEGNTPRSRHNVAAFVVATHTWAGTVQSGDGNSTAPLLVGAGRASIDPPPDMSAFRERDFDHRTKTSGNFPGIACRVTLGNIALIFTNGEMYARLGSAVKAASPLDHTVVIAYWTAPSTDYIPDESSVDEKTFQALGPVIPGKSDGLILGAERKLFESSRQQQP